MSVSEIDWFDWCYRLPSHHCQTLFGAICERKSPRVEPPEINSMLSADFRDFPTTRLISTAWLHRWCQLIHREIHSVIGSVKIFIIERARPQRAEFRRTIFHKWQVECEKLSAPGEPVERKKVFEIVCMWSGIRVMERMQM